MKLYSFSLQDLIISQVNRIAQAKVFLLIYDNTHHPPRNNCLIVSSTTIEKLITIIESVVVTQRANCA